MSNTLIRLAGAVDAHARLAATPHPSIIGPSGPTPPPGSDKWQTLLNIGLWVAVAILALIAVFAGVKFAAAYMGGEATREKMMVLGGVCVGATFSGTGVGLVNQLML